MKKLVGAMGWLVATWACGSSQVQQERPPSAEDFKDEGSDMDGVAEKGPVPVEVKEPTAAERRQKCCAACVAAFDKDRKGDPAEKVPCADYTADLNEECLKSFLATPATAAEAKQCQPPAAAAPPAGSAAPGPAPASP